MTDFSRYDLSIANTIIHNGVLPGTVTTIMACEICKNPFLNLLISNEYPVFVAEDARVTISIYDCPECGHLELDCMGCYGLPDSLPDTVMPFIGHFFELWFAMLHFAMRLRNDEDLDQPETQMVPVPLELLENWWKDHRPVAFNEEEHIENPDVNMSDENSGKLAMYVASLVKQRKGD